MYLFSEQRSWILPLSFISSNSRKPKYRMILISLKTFQHIQHADDLFWYFWSNFHSTIQLDMVETWHKMGEINSRFRFWMAVPCSSVKNNNPAQLSIIVYKRGIFKTVQDWPRTIGCDYFSFSRAAMARLSSQTQIVTEFPQSEVSRDFSRSLRPFWITSFGQITHVIYRAHCKHINDQICKAAANWDQ